MNKLIEPQNPAFARGAEGLTRLEYLIAHAPAMPEGWTIGEAPKEPLQMWERCKNHDHRHRTKTWDIYEFDFETGLSPDSEGQFKAEDVKAYRAICDEYTRVAVAYDSVLQDFLRANTPEKRAANWAITWAREVIAQLNKQEGGSQ